MFTEFNLMTALIGGLFIGLSATIMLAANGRIAGISGIVGGLFSAQREDTAWRWLFIIGILLGGFFYQSLFISPETTLPSMPPTALNIGLIIVAGLLVGYGTRMGSGCTSGHGVCGLGRLSVRSLVATLLYVTTSAGTLFIIRHLL